MLIETSAGNLYRAKMYIENKKGKIVDPLKIPAQDVLDITVAVLKSLKSDLFGYEDREPLLNFVKKVPTKKSPVNLSQPGKVSG